MSEIGKHFGLLLHLISITKHKAETQSNLSCNAHNWKFHFFFATANQWLVNIVEIRDKTSIHWTEVCRCNKGEKWNRSNNTNTGAGLEAGLHDQVAYFLDLCKEGQKLCIFFLLAGQLVHVTWSCSFIIG